MRPASFVMGFTGAFAALVITQSAHAQEFSYNPPGVLVAGSGDGRMDDKAYAPDMRFPIQSAPAFANSQVWGIGGSEGPAGSSCSDGNFSYPWSDNYCETRTWEMPLCPSGEGHQGQDIRAATCEADVHPVVASEAGTVTNVGSYSVYITAADGTRYDYVHMGSVSVGVGEDVTKGQLIGNVSNEFGGTPTTVHLHFNLRQNVAGLGTIYVPPYMSLVNSYQALVGPPIEPPSGLLASVTCDALLGFVEPTDGNAGDVRFYFDGEPGDGQTVGHTILSDLEVTAGCDAGCACDGTACPFGFEVPPPLSLYDGAPHTVQAFGSDGSPAIGVLANSPQDFSCAFELPDGVRRRVKDENSKNAWRFSSFWDELQVSDGILETLEESDALAASPRVVAGENAMDELYVVDGARRRRVVTEVSARAWGFDAAPELLPENELADLPEGPAWPHRPIVLVGGDGTRFLIDANPSDGPPPPNTGAGGSGNGGGGGEGVEDDAGCSCSTPTSPRPPRIAALALLGLLAFLRRRTH